MPRIHQQFMRILLFFDLPVTSKRDRYYYSRFRTLLLQDGYDMLQFSVYCRLCSNAENARAHLQFLRSRLPPRGSIRTLCITEKQYQRMARLIGNPTVYERNVGASQLVML